MIEPKYLQNGMFTCQDTGFVVKFNKKYDRLDILDKNIFTGHWLKYRDNGWNICNKDYNRKLAITVEEPMFCCYVPTGILLAAVNFILNSTIRYKMNLLFEWEPESFDEDWVLEEKNYYEYIKGCSCEECKEE